MLAAVGNHVEALHRFQVGNIILDNSLKEGEYRALTEDEIAFAGTDSHSSKTVDRV